jgi:hypothetical protein
MAELKLAKRVATPDGSHVTVVRVCLDIGAKRNASGQIEVVAAQLSVDGDQTCKYKRGHNMMAEHNGESWKYAGDFDQALILHALRLEMHGEEAKLVRLLNELV